MYRNRQIKGILCLINQTTILSRGLGCHLNWFVHSFQVGNHNTSYYKPPHMPSIVQTERDTLWFDSQSFAMRCTSTRMRTTHWQFTCVYSKSFLMTTSPRWTIITDLKRNYKSHQLSSSFENVDAHVLTVARWVVYCIIKTYVHRNLLIIKFCLKYHYSITIQCVYDIILSYAKYTEVCLGNMTFEICYEKETSILHVQYKIHTFEICHEKETSILHVQYKIHTFELCYEKETSILNVQYKIHTFEICYEKETSIL